MAAGAISREEMIKFIMEKDEFYSGVDLSKLNAEELTMLWETVRAAWLLGQERKIRSRGMSN
jgi:hypothetical protein